MSLTGTVITIFPCPTRSPLSFPTLIRISGDFECSDQDESAMPMTRLSWQPGYSLSRKPTKRSVARRNKLEQFEFIVEHPRAIGSAEGDPSAAIASQAESHVSPEHFALIQVTSDDDCLEQSYSAPSDHQPPIRSANFSDLPAVDSSNTCYLDSDDVIGARNSFTALKSTTCGHNVVAAESEGITDSILTELSTSLVPSIPSTVRFVSLTQRYKPILDRCTYYTYITICCD